jgi:hypothetical protein
MTIYQKHDSASKHIQKLRLAAGAFQYLRTELIKLKIDDDDELPFSVSEYV